jgi:hypothetical protein
MACLHINDFSLEPVTFTQNLFPTSPAIQRPPAQLVSECHSRQLGTAARRMLKIIALMTVAIGEEPPV